MQTKEELYAYIDSLNKKPSHYTADELYEIGLKHKSLPQNQKSWADLAEYVGYLGTSESLRSFINQRQAREKNNTTAAVAPLGYNAGSKAYEESYKEKAKNREILNTYRAELKKEARFETFTEELIKAVKQLYKLPKINKIPLTNQKGEAILMLSDWHIGEEVNNFYNVYNIDKAKTRIQNVVTKTINYCKINNIKKLNILNLGDLIEGIINENARLMQQIDVADEIMVAGELMAEALNLLQNAAPIVTYRSCVDNHSRSVADKHLALPSENFNRIIDWYLKTRLANSNIIFIDDNLDPGLGLFALENGLKIAFMHGHEDAKDKILQNVVGATQQWIDIVCCAHWHNPAEHTYQNMRLFINGSLCGTGPYALKRRLFTKPSQKLLIINNDFIDIDVQAD